MRENFYPKSEQILFTNREIELESLDFYLEEFLNGLKENVCILGLRRIGKTILIREFVKMHGEIKSIYLNLEFLFSVPIELSQNFILESAKWFFDKELELYDLVALPGGAVVKKLLRELEKGEASKTEVIRLAFEYLRALAREEKIVVFMDEFQEILKLKNYRELRNILGIFREYINDEKILFVISGSFPHIMRDMIANGESPLYNQFKELKLDYFDKYSAYELISKVIECDEESKRLIYQLTGGHPFYIVSIAKRTKLIHRIYELSINLTTIKRAFLIETLYPEGGIYKHCGYLLNTVLSLAKYKAPLIGILNTLLKEDGLTQSEIGKRIKVSQGEARLYISELERLDILNRIEDGYYIRDKVFKMWLDLRKTGEIGDSPKDKPMEIYLKILERKYLRAKTELGTAKEYEVREKLREKLGIKFKQYLEKDIEFDGVGRDNKYAFILEVKWKNKPADLRDVKKFLQKIEKSEFATDEKNRLIFVSKSGFTSSAFKFAKSNGIILLAANLEEV
jgi:AAA+ ATPase superfamily predicted ATPase